MKYIKMSAWANVPLKKEAEIVTSPSDENMKCLKIGDDYYNVDVMLMKYNKKEDVWIENDLEEILDQNYIMVVNGSFRELKNTPEKM